MNQETQAKEKEMIKALGDVLTYLEVAHLVAFRVDFNVGNIPTAKSMIMDMIERIRTGR